MTGIKQSHSLEKRNGRPGKINNIIVNQSNEYNRITEYNKDI